MSQPTLDSFLRNSEIHQRDGEGPLFEAYTDDQGRYVVRARLDGYAIIPIEAYRELLSRPEST